METKNKHLDGFAALEEKEIESVIGGLSAKINLSGTHNWISPFLVRRPKEPVKL